MAGRNPIDDIHFVRRCVRSDPGVWDEFIQKYSRLIYSSLIATLRLKGRERFIREYADDIFQDIFTLLRKDDFKKLKTYRGRNGCSLASWLRQVTVHYTIDYLRRSKLHVSLDAPFDEGGSLLDCIASEGANSREKAIEEDVLTHLAECVEQLAVGDVYFVELMFHQGLTPVETGFALGISREAVDMRKMRILERLKICFRQKGLLDL